MDTHQIKEKVITCCYDVNDVRYSVVRNAAGVPYLHIDDFQKGESFLKLSDTQLEEAQEIADAFARGDHRRAFALEKYAQRIRKERFLR